ncbi:MAG: DUF445 family protein [Clostridiaceae bacterium]|nr:DUF445 family protein [Clostridiaceae bacterium]
MDIKIITAPLVGGLIGLITNGLAIRMLFRPMKPVYIGKLKLPFTPGLIPKERPRLAKSIGEVISRDLLNKDTLRTTLLSDSMKESMNSKIDEMVAKYSQNEETVSETIEKFVAKNILDEKLDNAKEILSLTITQKAIEQDIGKSIVDYAYEEIMTKTKPVFKSITSTAITSFKQPLANRINTMIDTKSRPLIEKFLEDQAEEILNMPIKEIVVKYQDKIPQIKMYFWNIYEEAITKKLADVLDTVGISEVVTGKINELELPELEIMINELMKKELNALIWLGGLLGAVMGFINVIIDKL